MGITWTHLESVWNPSGPSEVPYSTNQELFFAVSYSKPALNTFGENCKPKEIFPYCPELPKRPKFQNVAYRPFQGGLELKTSLTVYKTGTEIYARRKSCRSKAEASGVVLRTVWRRPGQATQDYVRNPPPPALPLARCAASRYVRRRSIIVLLPKEWVLHDGGC